MVVVMDDMGYVVFVLTYIVLGLAIPTLIFMWKSKDGVKLLIARLRGITVLRVHWGDGYESLEFANKLDLDNMFFTKGKRFAAPIPYRIDSGIFETGKMARRDGVRIIDYYIGSAYPIGDVEAKAIEQCTEYIRGHAIDYPWLSSIEKDVTMMTVLSMPRDRLIQNATKYIRLDTTDVKEKTEVIRMKKQASEQLVEEAKKARIALSTQRVGEGVFAYHTAAMAVNNPFTTTIIKKMMAEISQMNADQGANQERVLKMAIAAAIVLLAGGISFYIVTMAH